MDTTHAQPKRSYAHPTRTVHVFWEACNSKHQFISMTPLHPALHPLFIEKTNTTGQTASLSLLLRLIFFFGAEHDNWENGLYDEMHRNFFLLLRHRNIDIISVHNDMQCSEELFGRFLQRNVLTRAELGKLVNQLSVLNRTAINQQLLEIVLKKPLQTQEVFVDLLLRYQSHVQLNKAAAPSSDPGEFSAKRENINTKSCSYNLQLRKETQTSGGAQSANIYFMLLSFTFEFCSLSLSPSLFLFLCLSFLVSLYISLSLSVCFCPSSCILLSLAFTLFLSLSLRFGKSYWTPSFFLFFLPVCSGTPTFCLSVPLPSSLSISHPLPLSVPISLSSLPFSVSLALLNSHSPFLGFSGPSSYINENHSTQKMTASNGRAPGIANGGGGGGYHHYPLHSKLRAAIMTNP